MRDPWIYKEDTFEVDESMVLNGRFIPEKIPDVVTGHFYCNYHPLIDLQGSPRTIVGTFNCSETGIISLKGAPLSVGAFFDCSRNKLTSLQYAPVVTMKNSTRYSNNIFNLDVEGKFIKSKDYDRSIQEGQDYWLALLDFVIKNNLNERGIYGWPDDYNKETLIKSVPVINKFNL